MKFTPVYSYKTKDYTLLKMHLNGSKQVLKFRTLFSTDEIRFLLTNIDNPSRMKIRNMNVVINGKTYPVTVNGKKRFVLPAHSEFYSDTIKVNIPLATAMVVQTRFSFFTKAFSASDFNSTKVIQSDHYGMLNRRMLLGMKTKAISKPHVQIVALVKQIEVMSDHKTITWFGDSLTNHSHYTQPLQERLLNNNENVSILNAGQSGNRLLHDGRNIMKEAFGIRGVKRIHHDVFEYNKPDAVVVALGINDLIHPGRSVAQTEFPTFEEMIEGYKYLLEVIHKHESKAIITTITPFKYYNAAVLDEAEPMRQALNDWILNQKEFDHVIDIASIVEDPNEPSRLAPEFRGDDNLHWDALGGQIVANKINIEELLTLIK